jgi:LCP family protein required for cell wall assembly
MHVKGNLMANRHNYLRSCHVTVLLLAAALGGLATAGLVAADDTMVPSYSGNQEPPPTQAPVTPIPPEVAVVQPSGEDILNVLLLGSDTAHPVNVGRTDALMIVSVNRTQGGVNLLSIPRDLFVYVPGGTMQRINTAYGLGEHGGFEGGGQELLKATIRYNLGITIDFTARINFDDFQAIIDAMGGVEITVDCGLQDWKLKSRELDPNLEENWELVTLPVGVHLLSGYDALWYARSRRTSSDFDRGRRQQDLVRAIWRRAKSLGLLSQVSAFWSQMAGIVDTDMRLEDLLGLVPVALTLDSSRIGHFYFEQGVQVRPWRTPDGAAVQIPNPAAVATLVERFMQPATDNRLVRARAEVEVVNASGYANMDRVAADLLNWDGFAAFAAGSEAGNYRSRSEIFDFSGRTKGSAVEALLDSLQLSAAAIVVQPDTDRAVDFRVILGTDYRSCRHPVMAPVATPTPAREG